MSGGPRLTARISASAAACAIVACMTTTPLALEARWNYDKPVESEALFRTMLAEDVTLGADEKLEVRTQISRALALQQRFVEADAELDAVARAGSRSEIVSARLHIERGRVQRSRGDAGAGRAEFELAFAAAERARHEFLAADALHMLAIVAPKEQAVAAHLTAIARVSRSPDARVRRWLAPLHNNLGWAHHDRGEFAEALTAFEKAVPLFEARGIPADVLLARWTVARAQRSLGRCEEALTSQRELLAVHAAAGSEDGFVHEEIAECLIALGRGEEARAHFGEAHRLLSQDAWLVRDEPARLERLKRHAEE